MIAIVEGRTLSLIDLSRIKDAGGLVAEIITSGEVQDMDFSPNGANLIVAVQ